MKQKYLYGNALNTFIPFKIKRSQSVIIDQFWFVDLSFFPVIIKYNLFFIDNSSRIFHGILMEAVIRTSVHKILAVQIYHN